MNGDAELSQTPSRNLLREAILAFTLFGALYIASMLIISLLIWPLVGSQSMAANQASGLAAVTVATILSRKALDHGRWPIGFGGGVKTAVRETSIGILFAVVLIGVVDLVIVAISGFRHLPGGGVDFSQLVLLFVPAAVHEELLCRGYPFQKFARLHAPTAVIGFSILFAVLHLGNDAIGPVALINIALAGVILSLAYLLYNRLWFPIGLHVFWNILSGPVLGHEVSGLNLERTLFRTVDPGPEMVTGGAFGIEGSVVTTVGEAIIVLFLMFLISRRNRNGESAVIVSDATAVKDERTSDSGIPNEIFME